MLRKRFKHSEETKTKIRRSMLRRGFKHSEETKAKIRRSIMQGTSPKERSERGRKAAKALWAKFDAEANFWSRVDKSKGPYRCWLWTGYIRTSGYGALGWKGVSGRSAHRIAYEIVAGPIPKGQVVMHSCDNKLCVNPRHLSLGRQRDNIEDAQRKKRLAVGTRVPQSKLNEQAVREIRQLASAGRLYRELATRYDVTESCISKVVKKLTWKHVK